MVRHPAVGRDTGWPGLAQVVVGGLVGIVAYLAVLVAVRADEMSRLQQRLRRDAEVNHTGG